MINFELEHYYKHKNNKDVVFEPLSMAHTRDGIYMTVLWYRIVNQTMLAPLQYDTITVTNDELPNWNRYFITGGVNKYEVQSG